MEVNEISKLMQLYMLQSQNLSDNTSSILFEVLLKSIMDEQKNCNNAQSAYSETYDMPQNTEGISSTINNAISKASKKYGIDQDLIKSVIKQESGFNPNARSSAGAEGLMQLMPKTSESLGVENPFNVLENIDGGTRYLKSLINSFNGDTKLALAAYNGGIGRMNRLGVDTDEEINRMPAETQNYVNKVVKNYQAYKESK